MTKAQNVFLIVIALGFVCWGTERFSHITAGVLALVFAAAIVLLALFGDV